MFSDRYSFAKRNGEQYHNPLVPGLHTAQRHWELMQLVAYYQSLEPHYILEIGTEAGGTLFHWIRHAASPAMVVNVDDFKALTDWGQKTLPDAWQQWCQDGVALRTVVGNSRDPEVIKQVTELLPRVDFLFIDGDHTYEGVEADWLNYGPLVRRGGIVAFHDLITPDFGPHVKICELWKEIRDAGYMTIELYAEPNEPWGGIGLVIIQ